MSTGIFGYNSILGSASSYSAADNQRGLRCSNSVGEDTRITGAYMYMYGGGVGGPQACRLTIYDQNESYYPDNLLGYSDEEVIPYTQSAGWQEFTFSEEVIIPSGTDIVLLLHTGANPCIIFRYATSGGGGLWTSIIDTYSNGPDDPCPAGGTSAPGYNLSIYAEYITRESVAGSTVAEAEACNAGVAHIGKSYDGSTAVEAEAVEAGGLTVGVAGSITAEAEVVNVGTLFIGTTYVGGVAQEAVACAAGSFACLLTGSYSSEAESVLVGTPVLFRGYEGGLVEEQEACRGMLFFALPGGRCLMLVDGRYQAFVLKKGR